MKKLHEDLGYDVHHKIVDASNVVPQHRERIFIAGFRKKTSFDFPEMKNGKAGLSNILEAK